MAILVSRWGNWLLTSHHQVHSRKSLLLSFLSEWKVYLLIFKKVDLKRLQFYFFSGRYLRDDRFCDICLGSGKTTFLRRLVFYMQASDITGYVINLDPAVTNLPFGANIDIRDTVRYKEVMKQYNIRANDAILTSFNLFATKFDQVIYSRFSFRSGCFSQDFALKILVHFFFKN